jgi:ankyrin repeat protein
VVGILVKKVEDREGIDARNTLGATALHEAARMGHTKVVRILLKKGADPKAWTKYGETAVDFAAKGHYEEVKKTSRKF